MWMMKRNGEMKSDAVKRYVAAFAATFLVVIISTPAMAQIVTLSGSTCRTRRRRR
jgi:hypothetical protein